MSLPFLIDGDLSVVFVEGSRRDSDTISRSELVFELAKLDGDVATYTWSMRFKHASATQPDIAIEVDFHTQNATVKDVRVTLRNCEVIALPRFLKREYEEVHQ